MFIYINGNLSSTTVGSFAIQNDTSATNFLLGQWFGNGTNYNSSGNFQLGELIYFNTFLAATQRQQIESYLAQKWGLVSSLPGGHLQLTRPAGARTGLSLVNSKFTVTPRPYSPIVTTVGNFTSIVGGAAGGGLWMTAVTPNGDIYTKSYNPTVYRLSGATYSNPFSCDNWGQGLTTDGSFVYGTDTNSAQIFRFNPATSTRNLMINSIASPCGLAADGIGNIYISQQIWQNPNNTLYRYNIAANTTTTLYNVSLSTYYFAGMAPDGLGNLYLSDYVTNKIYKLNSSNVLSAIAGSGTAGFADGTGAAASFNISMYINFSNNLCYDGNGNLYLAETNNNRIRKIVIATAVVTTIAGTGVSGTVDGPGLTARLAAPLGISYANGYLYWCEDKIVRRLTL
jgi:sugar lactone lactonase YvrE